MQKHKDSNKVTVEWYKPIITYEGRQPTPEERLADEALAYLTPFQTSWGRNPSEKKDVQSSESIVSSFKPVMVKKGQYRIPANVTGERYARDVRAQIEALAPDWAESGHKVDLTAL